MACQLRSGKNYLEGFSKWSSSGFTLAANKGWLNKTTRSPREEEINALKRFFVKLTRIIHLDIPNKAIPVRGTCHLTQLNTAAG